MLETSTPGVAAVITGLITMPMELSSFFLPLTRSSVCPSVTAAVSVNLGCQRWAAQTASIPRSGDWTVPNPGDGFQFPARALAQSGGEPLPLSPRQTEGGALVSFPF